MSIEKKYMVYEHNTIRPCINRYACVFLAKSFFIVVDQCYYLKSLIIDFHMYRQINIPCLLHKDKRLMVFDLEKYPISTGVLVNLYDVHVCYEPA